MPIKPSNPLIPSWSQDQLDCPSSPETEAAYFDPLLNAWVLSKYSDVLAAFRTSSLVLSSPRLGKTIELPDDRERARIRVEALESLSPVPLRRWRDKLNREVYEVADGLSTEKPVDLMDDYARPLCLSLAAMTTGISRDDGARLYEGARHVSAAAAEPYDHALRASAKAANAEIRRYIPSSPERLDSSGFVALSQTLPCLLGNAWFALIQYPLQWTELHQQPALIEQAIEELLRYSGLARTVTRIATADIDLNGCLIRKGEQVILRIIAANRDPDRFPQPSQVDIHRNEGAHFTLGSGSHSCVAAGLIRMAAATITRPLLERFGAPTLVSPVEWQGGSGFRFPRSLWVRLPRAPQDEARI